MPVNLHKKNKRKRKKPSYFNTGTEKVFNLTSEQRNSNFKNYYFFTY